MSILCTLPQDCIILDACCAITLFESGYMGAILTATQKEIAIASYVHEEEVKRANLQPLIDGGLLTVVVPEGEEEENTYVNYSVELEDGEAVSGAIAVHRNWAMATDETKAINFFARRAPQLQLVSTPELVKYWVETTNQSLGVARTVLQSIRTRARYEPGPQHVLHEWWQAVAS